ncbi:MAG: two-component system, OmpR family, sensor histidine kinase CpxA [Pyrinomonadaceae bacterium]|nr:two-component system, OmpR family, sensor histidine kinase CpxA [Pyrinomonadaceae bacterium]
MTTLFRSLFLKIFLWFGAVVLTVIVGTFIVGELNRPTVPPMRRNLDAMLDTFGRDAAREFETGGQPALVAYLDRVQRESEIRVFLFNSQLQELSGRRIPANAPGLVQQTLQAQRPQVEPAEHGAPLISRPVSTANGGQYVLVAEPPHGGMIGFFHPTLHLLAIILLGALFCYGLARYLTSPVAKLRAATQQLAQGNLRARVGPALGNRRDELASLAADFDRMADKIESLINSQRRLLGDISHELRSPLARLNVALELARQRSGTEATGALERIQREAETLNEMIGQLLTLTRLESGAEEIRKSEFDLTRLVTEVAADAEFEARSRERSVKLSPSPSCRVVGNEQLLRRAIENVVRNAVQYTAPETAVEVKLELPADSPSYPRQPSVVITVRDHGAGVPESALSEIFRPFYRVDEARNRDAGGVGLGLAIAERAVRLHGGKVEASNAKSGGLIVTIELPVQQIAGNSK